jgi:hypothetical protein
MGSASNMEINMAKLDPAVVSMQERIWNARPDTRDCLTWKQSWAIAGAIVRNKRDEGYVTDLLDDPDQFLTKDGASDLLEGMIGKKATA